MRLGSLSTFALLVLLTGACVPRDQPPRERDGVAYGVIEVPFRGRWWHYLERGVSYADGGFWSEAERDLRLCLRQRLHDARRARTYGMRFTSCFANRELGAVLLAQGRLDEAVIHLERSLSHAPSAKARALLRRAQRTRGELAGFITDPVVPSGEAGIALAAPDPEPAATLSGQVARPAAPGLDLFAVDDQGMVRVVPVNAAGRFTLNEQPSELMLASMKTGMIGTRLALAREIAPGLQLMGPESGSTLADRRVWYRYRVKHPAGIETIRLQVGQSERILASGGPWRHYAGTFSAELPPAGGAIRIVAEAGGSQLTAQRELIVSAPPELPSRFRAVALFLPLLDPFDQGWRDRPADAHLLAALIADGRFRYTDQRFDALLERELALADAGYINRKAAARGGRRLAARYVIAGTFRRNPREAECFLRVVDAATSAVVAEADAYAQIDDAVSDADYFAAVAGRLRQAFPVFSGYLHYDQGQIRELRIDQVPQPAVPLHFHLVEKTDQGRARSAGLVRIGPDDEAGDRLDDEQLAPPQWQGAIVSE